MPSIITRGAFSAKAFGLTGQTTSPVYVEDVFSTYLYTGNGSTQTITNGIDLATKGGMVWLKGRSGATEHALYDTARGATYDITSTNAQAQTTQSTGLTAFGATGFTIGSLAKINTSAATYAAWTFRRQPKFFTCLTYTGNDVAGRQIAHDLGCTPGFIVVKCVSSGGGWWMCYHKSLGATQAIFLEQTAVAQTSISYWNNTSPTSTAFTVGSNSYINANGQTYVAYLFADSNSGGFGPAGTDSVVACGSFNNTGEINLGWEAQYILAKNTSATGNWFIWDNMRGMCNGAALSTKDLRPNLSDAEAAGYEIYPTANGFYNGSFGSGTYIYLAIRRGPMKTPTDATKVFDVKTVGSLQANQTISTTNLVDYSLLQNKGTASAFAGFSFDRLRGTSTSSSRWLSTSSSTSEISISSGIGIQQNTGFIDNFTNPNLGAVNMAYWLFSRAPGFMDVVCFTGASTGAQTVSHNLGVPPEIIITKCRSTAIDWFTYNASIGLNKFLKLNATAGSSSFTGMWPANPTASNFTVNVDNIGIASRTAVAYLFATCPGVSKVGSYTGTGAAQNIDCGFSAGARFILIKRTDSTGDWYVYDSARGISSGNDPYLLLNSTAAEVTGTNYVDTYATGFSLTASAPAALNANGGSYIFLAIA